ncbi:unnamed protein product, partial [Ectocarpus sp. 12 AP-2014]
SSRLCTQRLVVKDGREKAAVFRRTRAQLLARTRQSLKASWKRTPPVRPDQLRMHECAK